MRIANINSANLANIYKSRKLVPKNFGKHPLSQRFIPQNLHFWNT